MKSGADLWPILILTNLVGGIFILLISLPFNVNLTEVFPYARFSIAILLWTVASYFDTESYRNLDVAVSNIFGAFRYVLLSIASVVLFGDRLTPTGIVGMIIITLSLLMTVDFRCANFRRGSFYRFGAIIFLNIATLNDRMLLLSLKPEALIISSFLVPGIIFALLKPRALLAIPQEIKTRRGLPLLIPFFQAGVYLAYLYCIKYSNVVLTATLLQLASVFVFLIGIFVLHERDKLFVRGIACLACIVGVILIATQ